MVPFLMACTTCGARKHEDMKKKRGWAKVLRQDAEKHKTFWVRAAAAGKPRRG
jgi:hypothetical protein